MTPMRQRRGLTILPNLKVFRSENLQHPSVFLLGCLYYCRLYIASLARRHNTSAVAAVADTKASIDSRSVTSRTSTLRCCHSLIPCGWAAPGVTSRTRCIPDRTRLERAARSVQSAARCDAHAAHRRAVACRSIPPAVPHLLSARGIGGSQSRIG